MYSFLVNYILSSAKYLLIVYIVSHFNDMSNQDFSTASTFSSVAGKSGVAFAGFSKGATLLPVSWMS